MRFRSFLHTCFLRIKWHRDNASSNDLICVARANLWIAQDFLSRAKSKPYGHPVFCGVTRARASRPVYVNKRTRRWSQWTEHYSALQETPALVHWPRLTTRHRMNDVTRVLPRYVTLDCVAKMRPGKSRFAKSESFFFLLPVPRLRVYFPTFIFPGTHNSNHWIFLSLVNRQIMFQLDLHYNNSFLCAHVWYSLDVALLAKMAGIGGGRNEGRLNARVKSLPFCFRVTTPIHHSRHCGQCAKYE